MRISSLVRVIGFALLGSVGFAQTPAAPSAAAPSAVAPAAPEKPDPARLEEARVLMKNMRFRETMMTMLNTQKAQLAQRIQQSVIMRPIPGATPEEIKDYQKRMIDGWWSQIHPDDVIAQMANTYAELFTVDQLRGMAEFYASPAGQALVDKTMELQQKSAAVLTQQMVAAFPALQKVDKDFRDAHAPKPAAKPADGAAPSAAAPASPSAGK